MNEMKIRRLRSAVPDLWWLIPAAGLFVVIALRGIRMAPRPTRGLVILWMAIPILLMATMSALNLKAPNSRYAFLSLAPYLILLSVGIASIRARILKGCVLAALILLMAYSDYQYFTNSLYWRPDIRAACGLIHREAQDGDIVVIYPLGYPVIYYLRDGLDLVKPAHKMFSDERSMMHWLDQNVAGRKRVWIVQSNGWWVGRGDHFLHLCQRIMTQIGKWQFTKVPVYLLENRGGWEENARGDPGGR